MLLIYQLIVLGILMVITIIAAVNLLTMRRFRDFLPAHPPLNPKSKIQNLKSEIPLLSILVPARNEERSIERCVRSLLAQDYPHFELIVLDDESEDTTGAIVERLMAEAGGRLRLVRGGELRAGWLGKTNACRQLAEQAAGEFLLFTDADTYHQPDAASAAIAAAQARGADLVTTFPRQEMVSWGERVLLPLLHFTVVAFLPLALANGPSRNPAFGVANGQFMLFRRTAYEAIGGHASVRDVILEDVTLARLIKRQGFRLYLGDGSDVVSCRMYYSSGETLQGMAKSLYSFFNYSLGFAAAMLSLHFLLFVAPYLLLLWGLAHPDLWGRAEWLLLPALQVGLMLAVRVALAARFGEPKRDALWQPVSFLFYITATLYAIWSRYAGGGVTWKGRRYKRPN